MQNSSTSPTRNHGSAASSSASASPAPPPRSGVTNNAAALSAALKGATLAFNNQKAAANKTTETKPQAPLSRSPNRNPTQSQQANPRTRAAGGAGADNGALLAATHAARDHSVSQTRSRASSVAHSPSGRQEIGRQETGGSWNNQGQGQGEDSEVDDSGLVAQRVAQYLHAGNGGWSSPSNSSTLLTPPGAGRNNAGDGGKQSSASFIAATLAASRSTSPTPNTNSKANNNAATPVRPGRNRGHSISTASFFSTAPSLGPKTGEALDTESIMPTTSLVSLFESKGGEDVDPVKKRDAPTPKKRAKTPSESPRGRSPGPAGENKTQAEEEGMDEGRQPQTKTKPKPKPKPKPKKAAELVEKVKVEGESKVEHREIKPPGTPPSTVSSPTVFTEVVSPQPRRVVKTPKLEPPAPPPARVIGNKNMKAPTVEVTAIRSASMEAARPGEKHTISSEEQRREVPPRMRRSSQCSVSSDDSFVSASSAHLPEPEEPAVQEQDNTEPQQQKQAPKPPKPRRRRASSPPPIRPTAPRLSTSNLGLDSLTNAIVASNLASSRLTPSTSPLPPPVPLPRRHNNDKSRPRSPLHPQRTADSLTSQRTGNGGSRSPKRTGMLQTLRQPQTSLSDDEDARRKMHRHAHRKGKVLGHHIPGRRNHAHHEGSRSRWRDEVSVRQKRRYEAVWASNKGLFMKPGWGFSYSQENENDDEEEGMAKQIEASRAQPGTREAELVVNIIVRDIWSRSRLPEDELGEIWELVDRGGKGALGREEFVVGMWLVDQRLRGRRLPARVGGSVWESVGGGMSVVVPGPPTRKGERGGHRKK
ncbi:hypothetical protein B0T21DRAFT_452278 [Apiosordaria backusii]|uniref:EH domain-containing protein n=1 Tax=Apiosordaria backusii TaxID=314023 RepID=A0AA40BEI4_9PEZI|nr:hypothetical protein B0T21DRAFT_452278 [Apiosordaria backusii]